VQIEDVIIIGAGPAGLSAAVQLKRYGLAPRLLEQAQVGGLLRNANLVENYPGFPGGITGWELVKLFEEQARCVSVQAICDRVMELSYSADVFQVTSRNSVYQARVAVIASGTRPRVFTEFIVPHSLQDRVLYEVYPLLDAAGLRIAIVGAGDAAFDYALNLARKNIVIILNRGDQVKCLPLLRERASAVPNISYHSGVAVTGLSGAHASGITLECTSATAGSQLNVDYLIGALGREPNVDFISPQLLENSSELEQRGILYWIGDVKNGIYRQTAIAVGDGIRAAMQIYRYFKETAE
jgi:thioredoxin reductase